LILKRSLLTFIALVIIFPWRSSIWLAGSSDTNTITAVYVAVGGVTDTEHKEHIRGAIREIFPKIPEADLTSIVNHAFEEVHAS
jgi:hypothetical protein